MKSAFIAGWWLLFPSFFVALWLLVCFLISLAGWRTLARHFRAVSKPDDNGARFPMQGASIGGAQYNGCLSLVVAQNGLWLQPWAPFRAFHPPLFLPWSAFGTPVLTKIWWAKQWEVTVQTPDKKRVKISVSTSLGQLLAARLQEAKASPQTSPWSENNALD